MTQTAMTSAEGPTVRDARDRFFRDNEFGLDGGYDDPWAEAEFGPVLYRVPNLAARAAALRVHDLHHLVTGYATDWRGESEISAWELGSGWGRYPYAWIIALFGFFTGLVAQPRATWRAFVRGRRSQNLYSVRSIDAVLDLPLSTLERRLNVPETAQPRARDAGWFGATVLVALGFALVAVPIALGLVLFAQTRVFLIGLVPTGAGCPLAGLAR